MHETARHLERDGVRLTWWRRGSGTAGTLLLVHGLASNATRWAEFSAHCTLADDWRLVRADLRGHGMAQADNPATLESCCADLAALLDAESAGEALNRLGLRRRQVVPDDLRAMDLLAREALRDPAREAAFIARYSSTRHDLRQMRSAQYLQDLVEMFRAPPALECLDVPVLTLLSTGATFAPAAATRARLATLAHGEVQAIDCHHRPLTERPAEVRAAIEGWVLRRFRPR